jgi:hypothetical protein
MKTIKMVAIALTALSLGSCEKESMDDENSVLQDNVPLVLKNFEGSMIQVEDQGDGTYSFGDINFAENQFSPNDYNPDPFAAPNPIEAKLNQGRGVTKWSNNTVVYSIESNFSAAVLSEFQASMQEWSSKTNVRFKERTNETDYVRIISNGASCNCGSAYLGVVNSNGFIGSIALGSGSTKSVITHEIGHTLGYTHEQNRVDRDQFINVLYENIQEGGRDQYFIATGSSTLTSALDYDSIMMYGSGTFGNGNGPTMTRIDNGQPVRGFGSTLTALDIEGTNNAYPGEANDNGGSTDICAGVASYRYKRYYVGDLVTYQGFLYRRDRTKWTQIGPCGSN